MIRCHRAGGFLIILLLTIASIGILSVSSFKTLRNYYEDAKIESEKIKIISIRLKLENYISIYDKVPTYRELVDTFFITGFPEEFAYLKVDEEEYKNISYNKDCDLDSIDRESPIFNNLPGIIGKYEGIGLLSIISRHTSGKLVLDNPVNSIQPFIQIKGIDKKKFFGTSDQSGESFIKHHPQYIIRCTHDHYGDKTFLVATRYFGPVLENELSLKDREKIGTWLNMLGK